MKKCIVFHGDRSSKTIAAGYLLIRLFGKKRIYIDLWDGYPSKIWIAKSHNRKEW